jgi:hypothetical protein
MDRLEKLEKDTAPGSEMAKDLNKASTYALQEYKRIGEIVELKLSPKCLKCPKEVEHLSAAPKSD